MGAAAELALPVARAALGAPILQGILKGKSDSLSAPPAAPLHAKILREWPEVLRLEDEWRELLGRSDADPLFLSWEWLESWYDVVGQTRSPYVIVVRDSSGRLLGVAPFYRSRATLLGTVSYRGLRLMADYPTGSEYLDWIVDKEQGAAAFEALARAFAEDRTWDFVWLPYCAGWSGASTRLAGALQAAGLHTRMREEVYASMPLPATFDEYLKSLSRRRREKVRQTLRRSDADAGCEVVHCTSQEDIPRFLDALFDLHGRRWQQRSKLGTFQKKPTAVAFYRRFAPAALEKGWLRLAGVVRNGEFLAVQLGYLCGGVFYQIQEGFDPATQGVGNALRARIIDRSITEDRLTGYDFLAGFSEGKSRWGATPRMGHALLAIRPSLRTMALRRLSIWPTGRYFHFADLGQ